MARYKIGPARIVFNILNYTFFTLFTLLCVYPLWYVFIYTISDPALVTGTPVTFYPVGFSMYNLSRVIRLDGLAHAFFISVARTVVGTALTVICCMLLGYVFSQENVPFRKLMYRIMVVTMYVSGGLIPTYLVIRAYGIMNTFWIYIIPPVSAYYVILIKTYIEQLPPSLQESALIDGASYLRIFIRIIMPLSMPIAATIGIYSAVEQWNAWFDNHIYTFTNDKLLTLQYLLYNYLTEAERMTKALEGTHITEAMAKRAQNLTPMGVRMTVTLITVMPILLVYPFLQRYFIKGILIGAIKG
ncbi:MAG: carbohydrate ABC transporter permease [Clostridiales bacterium]|jgi:putative aldouronate transport system permease protein|nr:carbohydrate ABC transporter permease [Clostridiales bacterium]